MNSAATFWNVRVRYVGPTANDDSWLTKPHPEGTSGDWSSDPFKAHAFSSVATAQIARWEATLCQLLKRRFSVHKVTRTRTQVPQYRRNQAVQS